MESDLRRRFIVIFLIILAAIGLRVAFLLRARHESRTEPETPQPAYSTDMDQYVTPAKTFAYDVKSAQKELDGKTVWVKGGNQMPYYRYNPRSHAADIKTEVGVLPPLQQLTLRDFVLQRLPASLSPGQVAVVKRMVLAVFQKPQDEQLYAVRVGTNVGDDYDLFLNDAFFFDDPRQLYKHWPADTWQAIDRHEAKAGMNELQVSFALGTSATASPGDYGNRTMEYTNDGHPVTVVFSNNKAIKVTPQASQ